MKELGQFIELQKPEILPFINGSDFIGFATYLVKNKKDSKDALEITSSLKDLPLNIEKYHHLENVPIGAIIGSFGMQGWEDIYKKLPHVYAQEQVEKMKSGTYPLLLKMPLLIRIGEVFIDCGIGITTAAAKIAKIENIPARVLNAEISKVTARSPKDFNELLQRKKYGLWKGSFSGKQTTEVVSHRGTWVFSKNMQMARKAYFSLE